MKNSPSAKWVSWLLTFMFLFMFFVSLILSLSGYAWNILPDYRFHFWLILLTFLLAVIAGMVASYSFVSFSQTRELKSLMLLILGLNLILWVFLYMITHPSSSEWSSFFADRARNRTLGIAFVLIAVPCILLGSFGGHAKPSRLSVIFLIVWGTILMPLTCLWFFFSPFPVFLMTNQVGGIEGLTPIGLVVSFGYLISQIVAALRLAQNWRNTRDILDLSLLYAMLVWLVGTAFIIILWDPLQIAELIWVGSIAFGLLFVGAVQFITSIIDPHRALESLVDRRTSELELSKKESEFYLNMWTHKMGNILQGLITYLDILELGDDAGLTTRSAAKALGKEATLVNHQVTRLTQIKNAYEEKLRPTLIKTALENGISSAQGIVDEELSIEITGIGKTKIMADDLLNLAFQSAILFFYKHKLDSNSTLSITEQEFDMKPAVLMKYRSERLPNIYWNFLTNPELTWNTGLDLDLFALKLLMIRYEGELLYKRDDSNNENTFILIFNPA